jgi:large conductance mechanosensitive channel
MLKEFRKFIARGNVVDMAVGIAVGAAFGAIAKSLVDDVIMPPVGLLLGGHDFSNFFALLRDGTPPPPYATLAQAQAAHAVTLNYGLFINAILTFFIIAFAFFLIVRMINRLQQIEADVTKAEPAAPAPPTDRECPYCLMRVPLKATRCGYCTSTLEPGG